MFFTKILQELLVIIYRDIIEYVAGCRIDSHRTKIEVSI